MIPETVFNLEGWCTKEKAYRLYNLVKESNSKLSVELGVFGGKSLIPIALAHKEINNGICIGIDPWCAQSSTESYDPNDPNYQWWDKVNYNYIFDSFINSLIKYQVNNIVTYYRKKSNEVINLFENESIDILHQDGNHSETISTEEIELYNTKIKPNGFWIMDDTDWPTTSKAQDLILTKGFILYEDHIKWKIYKKTL